MIFSILIGALLGLISLVIVGLTLITRREDQRQSERMAMRKLYTIMFLSWLCTTIFVTMIDSGNDYANAKIAVAEIETDYKYSIENILILANSLNEKVVVKTENDHLLIDVANMSQSSKTSEVYISYVRSVTTHNNNLSEYRTKSQPGVFNKLFYGFYPPVPEDVKFIKIKM